MKYKLININTNEQHLSDKVIIDGFDYYVSDEKINVGDWYIVNSNFLSHYDGHFSLGIDCKKVIATNNQSIDIPKVVDKVERLAFDYYEQVKRNYYSTGQKTQLPKSNKEFQAMGDGFIEGYNKSQETHPFSEQDMIEFAEWIVRMDWNELSILYEKSTKELFQLWKEKQTKTLTYE